MIGVQRMSCTENLQRVLDTGIVAILRAPSSEQLTNVAKALFEGGIDVIEVTFTGRTAGRGGIHRFAVAQPGRDSAVQAV